MTTFRRALQLILCAAFASATVHIGHRLGFSQSTPRAYVPLLMRDFPLPPSVFGIGINDASPTRVSQLQDTKSSWTRVPGIEWHRIEPTEGARNWSAVAAEEQDLKNLADGGVKVTLIVKSTPIWAQRVTNQYCGPVKPEKYAAMAAFIKDLVARYSVAPYNVEYFEFWNEPDAPFKTDGAENKSGFGCWGDLNDQYFNGREYGAALKVAYGAVKQGNPQAKLLVGGLLMDCSPTSSFKPICSKTGRFLEGMLLTAGSSFDGVSFHAYDAWPATVVPGPAGIYTNPGWNVAWNTTGPGLIVKSQFIKQRLQAAGVTGKSLMNTETGVIVWGTGSIFERIDFDLTKAYYVPQAYSAAIAEGLLANIWYDMTGWNSSGLVRGDQTTVPAYTAIKIATVRLGRARYLGPITPADLGGATNVAGYKFDRGDRKVWVVWSRDGLPRNATFATAPLEVVDALGAAQSTSTSIAITIKPLYIEWP